MTRESFYSYQFISKDTGDILLQGTVSGHNRTDSAELAILRGLSNGIHFHEDRDHIRLHLTRNEVSA